MRVTRFFVPRRWMNQSEVEFLLNWAKVDICGENEYCQNTVGSYDCFCKKGYELSDNVCKKKVLSER